MAGYSGVARSITPSTTDDNWTLDAGAGKSGRVKDVHWGGQETTSTAMCTRIARSGSQAGAGTAGNVSKRHPNHVTNVISFFTTYATTQPTLDAGDLLAESWNAHGGLMRYLLAPEDMWFIVGAGLISCRNSVGIGVSTYGVFWEED